MPVRNLIFAIVALFMICAVPAGAVGIESVRVTESAKLPVARPDWPTPSEPNQLFYVQRSLNSNTVIYAARFNKDGSVNRANPMHAYWRRYDTNGARKELGFFEKKLAYGVRIRRGPEPGQYFASPNPLRKVEVEARHTGPGQAELLGFLGGRKVRLKYAYVDVDESGAMYRLRTITVYGIEIKTGRAITETFAISGAVFPK